VEGGYQLNMLSSAVNVVCGDDVVTDGTVPTILIDVPAGP
jgi:hypothetical protein